MDLSSIWIFVGMATTVLIVGIAWGDIRRQVHTVVKQWEETQKWVKEVQIQQNTNTTDIAVLAAIVKDRTERDIN